MTERVSLDLIDPHPDNPRFALREEIVQTIRKQIEASGYDEVHSVLLRRLGDRFQLIDGHHRTEAARRAGLADVPAWIREYTNEEAFMQLALANAQTGLTPLERGRHALAATKQYGKDGGLSVAKYAERIGRKERTVQREAQAFEVYESVHMDGLEPYFRHLVAIHAAPREKWAALATEMVKNNWSVQDTERAVRECNRKAEKKANPAITLEAWKSLAKKARADLLDWRSCEYHSLFNKQEGESIDWAKWSWNPVTGCLHNCPYCYARDIAERFYPQKFAPTLHVDRLFAPYQTPVPAIAANDTSHKNVFVCSMADLFGQWVPREWIEAVLAVVRDNSSWNFLFLTKFPIRMAEFEYPDNAWLGTTVDLQARVKNAERAMRDVKASVKWLSIEPLLEPLKFEDLSAFQWMVIGGASASSQTPEWRPPRRWLWDLTFRAQDAGCLVYHKTNLPDRLKQFPSDADSTKELQRVPEVFRYLKVVS